MKKLAVSDTASTESATEKQQLKTEIAGIQHTRDTTLPRTISVMCLEFFRNSNTYYVLPLFNGVSQNYILCSSDLFL